jgi:hypothetical protein
MGVLRVLDRRGDTEYRWGDDPAEIAAAKAIFDELLGAGRMAITPERNGKPAELIKSFNPEQEEVVIIPRMVGG